MANKYINAEKLKAEIKAREKVHFEDYHIKKSGGPADYGAANALHQLLPFIESLMQEQPVLPGIEDPGIPGKDYIPAEWVDACEMYGKWKIVKQEQPGLDLEKEIDNVIADYSFTKTIDSGGFKTTILDYAKIARHGKNSK